MSVRTAMNTVITPAAEAVPSAYTLLRERVQEAYTVLTRPVFAVVELAGTQYKVTPNDTIVTERIPGVDVNDRISLDRVLLAGTAEATIIGRPVVPGVTVTAAVEVSPEQCGWGQSPSPCACRHPGEGGSMLDRCPSPTLRRSNSWTARCSSSTSDEGRTPAGPRATARCAGKALAAVRIDASPQHPLGLDYARLGRLMTPVHPPPQPHPQLHSP